MLVELHTHTIHSLGNKIRNDGVESPETMVKYASKKGIDSIVITDHDTLEGYEKVRNLNNNINVFPGQEITTKDGHVLAIGINEVIKPGLTVEESVDKVHEQGGISIAAHPFDILNVGLGKKALHCDAIEAFNAINIDKISNVKARNFAKKNSKPIVAGSDAHFKEMLGHGITKIDASDLDGMLKAIKNGNTEIITKYQSVKTIRDWKMRKLRMSYNHVHDFIDNNYSNPKKFVAKKALKMVKYYPGRIEKVLTPTAYILYSGILTFGAIKSVLGINKIQF